MPKSNTSTFIVQLHDQGVHGATVKTTNHDEKGEEKREVTKAFSSVEELGAFFTNMGKPQT